MFRFFNSLWLFDLSLNMLFQFSSITFYGSIHLTLSIPLSLYLSPSFVLPDLVGICTLYLRVLFKLVSLFYFFIENLLNLLYLLML